MSILQVTHHRFVVHGLAVSLRCAVPRLSDFIQTKLSSLAVAAWPAGTTPISGAIGPYCVSDVQRHLNGRATLVGRTDQGAEIYQAQDRFWLIDDRRGLVELNPTRSAWRSWVLPTNSDDPADLAATLETAVIWPAAQLLRNRDLFIIPALSVARDGWGMLVLCPFGLETEARALVDAGFRLIGQRWTALREEDGHLSLLHLPGRARRTWNPRRSEDSPAATPDLAASQHQSFCDAVLIIEPSRRPVPRLRPLESAHAVGALRRAWPINELYPHRRQGRLPALLARHCEVFEAQLTPDPRHLLRFANAMRFGLADGLAVPASSGAPASLVLASRAQPSPRATATVTVAASVRARAQPSAVPAARRRLMGHIRKGAVSAPQAAEPIRSSKPLPRSLAG